MSHSAIKLSTRKKILFSSLLLCGLALTTEVALRVLGIGRPANFEDPFVGFDAKSPVFVSAEDSDGMRLETAAGKQVWFNYQTFARKKAGNTKRVFCLGGSTTFGRPFDDHTAFSGWLREILPLVDSSTQWEVINAGGVSYASYRVANVMEELCEYEPDLFVILTGHNEFLERRTYAGLLEKGLSGDQVVARTRRILKASRLFNLIEGFVRPEANFQVHSREKLPEEVDEILNHSAGPKDYQRDDQWHANVLVHLRSNLERMVAMGKTADAKVLFISPTSNLRDCLPFKSVSDIGALSLDVGGEESAESREPSEEDFATERNRPLGVVLQEKLEKDGAEETLKWVTANLANDPRNADLLFFQGRCLFRLKQHSEARRAFLEALDEDVCPLRATTEIRQMISSVAAKHQMPCVDFDDVLGRESMQENGHQCFGADYFLDHVHPSIETHRLIALSVIRELQGIGWLAESDLDENQIGAVTQEISSRVDPQRQAVAFRNLAKVLHWAGKFEEAIPKAVDATRLLPDDLESWFVMADCLRQLGRDDEAYLVYQQLFQKGDYGRAYLPFGELLMDLQRYDRAVEFLLMATIAPSESHRIRALYDLGFTHLQLGQYDLALESLLECERLAGGESATVALIGEALFSLGRFSEAESRFSELLDLNGDPVYAYLRLAEVCLAQQRELDAEKFLVRCLEIDPHESRATALLEHLRSGVDPPSPGSTGNEANVRSDSSLE